MNAATFLPPDCPECRSVSTQTEADGHAICHSCGRRWALPDGAIFAEFEGVSPITVTAIAPGEFQPALVRCSVVLPDSGRVVEVEVSGPRTRFGSERVGATCSWPSIGSVGFTDTDTFGVLVRFAARMGSALEVDD